MRHQPKEEGKKKIERRARKKAANIVRFCLWEERRKRKGASLCTCVCVCVGEPARERERPLNTAVKRMLMVGATVLQQQNAVLRERERAGGRSGPLMDRS